MILLGDAVRFEPVAHEYFDAAGQSYPSTTAILKCWSKLAGIPPSILEAGRERGELVHLATELDDQGTLDDAAIDPEILAYVRGWRKFRQATGFAPEQIEVPFICRRWGYAGTFDRYGYGTLLDIKSGVPDPTHGPQTAAYAQPLVATGHKVRRRLTVYLRPDDYVVEDHTGHGDWGIFMAALSWHRWKQLHNL